MSVVTSAEQLPRLIQGGMGVGISHWKMARAVSVAGALGVCAGALLDTVFVRRLMDGDPGGHLRRALDEFPQRTIVDRCLSRWFIPGGKSADEPYRLLPIFDHRSPPERQAVAILAAFAEIFLAKEGHGGPVGLNLLTKIAPPNPAMLYGAMLADVDVVIMGAGIPKEVPAVLDALSRGERAAMRLEIDSVKDHAPVEIVVDPHDFFAEKRPLRRPFFLPIISSNVLAQTLAKKSSGRVDGFIVEGPTAGGHNAPPRGAMQLDARGEPIYGPRDQVDLAALKTLGLPFWTAGGMASPLALERAILGGARGIQVGTAFAFCRESGLDADVRKSALRAIAENRAVVFTDPRASPTYYPFKHLLTGDADESALVRDRVCDLGYLRNATMDDAGAVIYRCPAEPAAAFAKKGGAIEDTSGRVCLCNALLANIGHAQRRTDGSHEPTFLTCGDDLDSVHRMIAIHPDFCAADVVRMIGVGEIPETEDGAAAM